MFLFMITTFSALTLLVGWLEGHPACKKIGGWWRRALVSPDGVAPAGWSVCLPLLIFPRTIKSRSSILALAHLGGPGKRAIKRLWWRWWIMRTTLQTIIRLLGVDVVKQLSDLQQFRLDWLGRVSRQHLDETSHLLFTGAVEALQRLQLHEALQHHAQCTQQYNMIANTQLNVCQLQLHWFT